VSEEKKTTEEQLEEEQGFWAKNILSIFLIIFLIVSGVYAFNRDTNTDKKDMSVEEKVEEIKQDEDKTQNEGEEKREENQDEAVKTENESKNNDISVYIQKTDSAITVKARIGDGVTHLARNAVSEYIKDKNISLSKEQRLYAETVLKNTYYQKSLTVGQDISFSLDNLSDTVQKAQNLTEGQIHAWSKYTASVPSL
jgi:uncharacterized protein YpmB